QARERHSVTTTAKSVAAAECAVAWSVAEVRVRLIQLTGVYPVPALLGVGPGIRGNRTVPFDYARLWRNRGAGRGEGGWLAARWGHGPPKVARGRWFGRPAVFSSQFCPPKGGA